MIKQVGASTWESTRRVASARASLAGLNATSTMGCPGEGLIALGGSGEQGMQWLKDTGTPWDKNSGKIDQFKELTQLALGHELRELTYSPDLVLQRMDTLAVHMMAQELQLGNIKQTLGRVNQNAMLIQALRDQT